MMLDSTRFQLMGSPASLTVTSVSTGWVTRVSAAKGVTFCTLQRGRSDPPQRMTAGVHKTEGIALFAAVRS